MYATFRDFNIYFSFTNKFYDKRRIIQDLNFLGIVSDIREIKDSAFLNVNAEIAIKVSGSTAVGTLNLNAHTNQRLIISCINHRTSYPKLLGIYTTGHQYE